MTRLDWYRREAEEQGQEVAFALRWAKLCPTEADDPDDLYYQARIAGHFGLLALGHHHLAAPTQNGWEVEWLTPGD